MFAVLGKAFGRRSPTRAAFAAACARPLFPAGHSLRRRGPKTASPTSRSGPKLTDRRTRQQIIFPKHRPAPASVSVLCGTLLLTLVGDLFSGPGSNPSQEVDALHEKLDEHLGRQRRPRVPVQVETDEPLRLSAVHVVDVPHELPRVARRTGAGCMTTASSMSEARANKDDADSVARRVLPASRIASVLIAVWGRQQRETK